MKEFTNSRQIDRITAVSTFPAFDEGVDSEGRGGHPLKVVDANAQTYLADKDAETYWILSGLGSGNSVSQVG